MPSCKKASAKGQLRFIPSIRNACVASARFYPSRPGRFHGRNPANARRREESTHAVRSEERDPFFPHSVERLPGKWQHLPSIHRSLSLPHWICAVTVQVAFSHRPGTTERQLTLFSFESSGLIAPSPCRLSDRRSRLSA